jgi:hypothetical protein
MSDDELRVPRLTPAELERQAMLKAEFDRVIADPDVKTTWDACKAAVGIGDPEFLALNIRALAALFEAHSPLFCQWYSCDDEGKRLLRRSLNQWVIRDVARDLARSEGVPQEEVDSYFAEELPTLGTRRVTPDNPFVKGPDGVVVGPPDDTKHYLAATTHLKALRPEDKGGRRRGSGDTKPRAVSKERAELLRKCRELEGQGRSTKEIAAALYPRVDLRDAIDRVYRLKKHS